MQRYFPNWITTNWQTRKKKWSSSDQRYLIVNDDVIYCFLLLIRYYMQHTKESCSLFLKLFSIGLYKAIHLHNNYFGLLINVYFTLVAVYMARIITKVVAWLQIRSSLAKLSLTTDCCINTVRASTFEFQLPMHAWLSWVQFLMCTWWCLLHHGGLLICSSYYNLSSFDGFLIFTFHFIVKIPHQLCHPLRECEEMSITWYQVHLCV